jgi:hypothetical protein
LTVLDWTFVAIVVGCMQTIGIRLIRILRALQKQEATMDDQPPKE